MTDAESTRVASHGTGSVHVCDLVGRDAVVQVLGTDFGTRYTLCSTEGAPIARDLDAHGLARLRPDLDPSGLQADWGHGPLMMADFDR